MATCTVCGKPAGWGNAVHDECAAAPPPTVIISNDALYIVEKLTPVILRAGWRAGLSVVLFLVGFGLLFGLLRLLLSAT